MSQNRPPLDVPGLIVTYVCSVLALLLIFIRLLCRRMRGEKYLSFHDDIWMGLSVIPLLSRLALVHVILLYGTNAVPPELAAELTPFDISRRVTGSKMVLAARILYCAFLWCMKACVLGFLHRLMSADIKFARTITIIGWGFALTFSGNVLVALLECRPLHMYFQVVPNPGDHCTKALAQLMVLGITNIITDLALIILPLPLIYKSRLPLTRKLQFSFLFSVGLFLIVITVVRMPLIADASAIQHTRTLWASIEIFAACLVANAPILNNFYCEHKRKKIVRSNCSGGGGKDEMLDDELHSGYSMKFAKPRAALSKLTQLRRKSTESPDTTKLGGRLRAHSQANSEEESLTANDGPGSDLEVGSPVNSLLSGNHHHNHRNGNITSSFPPTVPEVGNLPSVPSPVLSPNHIQNSTQFTQNVNHITSDARNSQYCGSDFLGWSDHIFPGPRDPAQHVKYGMSLAHQNTDNGAPVYKVERINRGFGCTVTDIPSLGVLPSAPPRALLNRIAGRRRKGGWGSKPSGEVVEETEEAQAEAKAEPQTQENAGKETDTASVAGSETGSALNTPVAGGKLSVPRPEESQENLRRGSGNGNLREMTTTFGRDADPDVDLEAAR